MRGTNDYFELILGETSEGNLVFADLSLRTSPDRETITVAVGFNEVSPFEANYDVLEYSAESMLEDMDDYDTLNLLEGYDCAPSQLLDYFMDGQMFSYGIEGLMDISLYPQSYSLEEFEDDIYFESVGCGQMDPREDIELIDQEVADIIFYLWDEYHLEKLTGEDKERIGELFKSVGEYYENFDEHEWVQNWLECDKDNIRIG